MVRIHVAVSLRFPPPGKSAEGEAGAKARPKGVADAQPVHIPALPYMCPRGTQTIDVVEPEAGPCRHPDCPLERVGAPRVVAKRLERYAHIDWLPRKARREITCKGSVPIPTQVDEASSLRCSR